MRLSDFKDEAAIELVADLIEPMAEIFGDREFVEAFKGESKARAVALAIKKHKSAVMSILAAMDGVPVEDFHCNAFTLPKKAIEFLSDKELVQLFTDAGMIDGASASSSLSANAEAGEQ